MSLNQIALLIWWLTILWHWISYFYGKGIILIKKIVWNWTVFAADWGDPGQFGAHALAFAAIFHHDRGRGHVLRYWTSILFHSGSIHVFFFKNNSTNGICFELAWMNWISEEKHRINFHTGLIFRIRFVWLIGLKKYFFHDEVGSSSDAFGYASRLVVNSCLR